MNNIFDIKIKKFEKIDPDIFLTILWQISEQIL